MTEKQEIRAKAIELALLSFHTNISGMFERLSEEGESDIPRLVRQRATAIEDFIRDSSP